MALAVYSTRFAAKTEGSGGATYVVPTGVVIIVRDIDWHSSGGAQINVRASVGGDPVFAGGQFTVEAIDQFIQWRGRQLLNAGEVLEFTGDGPFGVMCSGYTLTLP